MIKLRRRALSAVQHADLARYQALLATAVKNDPAIRNAWNAFTADKAVRPDIAKHLRRHSAGKCAFCENACANTIDHFYPKLKYPQRAFDWDNLLWACWPCNTAKRNQFPVQRNGTPVYLNPMTDNPADFFTINRYSGLISPRYGLTPADASRAKATIKQLKLNRDGLPEQRRLAAVELKYVLEAYEAVQLPQVELLVIQLLSKPRAFRAVVRQMLREPDAELKLLVDFCLAHSNRLRRCLQAITW